MSQTAIANVTVACYLFFFSPGGGYTHTRYGHIEYIIHGYVESNGCYIPVARLITRAYETSRQILTVGAGPVPAVVWVNTHTHTHRSFLSSVTGRSLAAVGLPPSVVPRVHYNNKYYAV